MALLTLLGAAQAGTFPAASRKDLAGIQRRVEASHFLSRTTFGPTLAEIDALADRIDVLGRNAAFEEWIDEQFAIPATEHEPLVLQMIADDGFTPTQTGISPHRYKHYAWWATAIRAPDQLRQRMAWALAQIFVINEYGPNFNSQSLDASGNPYFLGVTNYYDMLLANAFGNYRQLFEDVTLHPIMGVFLSHVRNPKGDPAAGRYPDENYGREAMQLLSLGLYELTSTGENELNKNKQLVEAYDNETIKSFARVFTGLSYGGGASFYGAGRNYHDPMEMYESYHDTDAKTLLNGTVLPAGQSGMQDISDGLDNLFNHHNAPVFISRQLIQRLVKSNPSKSYLRRVAGAFIDNGSGVRGDFKAVLKAILLDAESTGNLKISGKGKGPVGLKVTTKGTEHSRLREPVLRYAAAYRSLTPSNDYPTDRFMIPALDYYLNQEVYRAHHIFNFYLPGHRPAGDIIAYETSKQIPNDFLVAPEFEIFTPVAANRTGNLFRALIRDGSQSFTLINNSTVGKITTKIDLDYSYEESLAANPLALMTHLDLLLCQGAMLESSKQIIADTIAAETSVASYRAAGAILATLQSSDCAVAE
jgi:uncharacterized protein (DUF1800 family)